MSSRAAPSSKRGARNAASPAGLRKAASGPSASAIPPPPRPMLAAPTPTMSTGPAAAIPPSSRAASTRGAYAYPISGTGINACWRMISMSPTADSSGNASRKQAKRAAR